MILIMNSTEIVMLAQYLINIELVKRYCGEDTGLYASRFSFISFIFFEEKHHTKFT